MHFDDSNVVPVKEIPVNALTTERLMAMGREELLAVPFIEYDMYMRSQHGPANDDLVTHIRTLLASDIRSHVERLEAAYAAEPTKDIPELIRALAKEPDLIIIYVWSAMTQQGLADLDKAKWLHKQMCSIILKAFYPGNAADPGRSYTSEAT